MGWRYFAETLNGDGTATPLASDLPLQDVTITEVLSGPDLLTASINPRDDRLRTETGAPLFQEWKTAIYAEENDHIRVGTIFNHNEENGPSFAMECVGFGGYPAEQPYTDPVSWNGVEVDPLDVVRKIWDWLQAQPDGNLGMILGDTLTGKKIGVELQQGEFDTQSGPLSYESGPFQLGFWLAQDLGAEIDKLSESTPFDWRERHRWLNNDTIGHNIDFGYPRLGRRLNDLRFVLGENIRVIPTVTVSGADYASEVLALGAGEGRAMIHATQKRATGRLRRAKVVTKKSAKDQRAINAVALAELQWRAMMDGDITELQLSDHPHAPVGSVSPGDEIFVQGRLGWRVLEMWCRVTAVSFRPSDPSAQTLSVVRSDRVTS
jgi:hypothetical protein